MPALRLWNAYGQTEIAPLALVLRPEEQRDRAGSAGRPVLNVQTRVDDDAMRDVQPGEVGEVVHRSPQLMTGYWRDPERTAAAFAGGWFMSGDLGRFDDGGNLEIVGRKKDLIIRGGRNIHPAKIEDLTMRHKAVARCAAFPVADTRLGEKVCLSVIFHERAGAQPDELLQHLHETGLSRYDMPEYFIALTEYPLTASGKILKRELVEWAKSGRIRPEPLRWTGPARPKE